MFFLWCFRGFSGDFSNTVIDLDFYFYFSGVFLIFQSIPSTSTQKIMCTRTRILSYTELELELELTGVLLY